MVNNMGRMLDTYNKDNKILKIIFFLVGLFFSTLVYNSVFVPYNIVIGGVSGMAIVFKELTHLSTTIFIDVANAIIIVIGFIFLGKKEMLKQLAGCILYPLTITLTVPIASFIKLDFAPPIIIFFLAAIVFGLANGLVYRTGFLTGGLDIIIQIISNKTKKSITTINPIISAILITTGGIVFSPVMIMYSLFVTYISNESTNIMLNSLSTNKMVYVISTKNKDIENYIMNTIKAGATEIKVHSGLFEKKKQMLMCILHNSQYYNFKHSILKLDPNAFILSKRCYEVTGGNRFKILPF